MSMGIARTITAMPIDTRLITLTQWLSPSYPIGAFAYSHGLESAIVAGWVSDAPSLQSWLSDLISCGSARSDAAFVIRATREDVQRVNDEARAFAASAERLREAEKQGAAFADVTREVWRLDLPNLMLPVALGKAVAEVGINPEDATALYLHAFASALTGAAQRLMPLGQTSAQAVLHALTPLCARTAGELVRDPTPWSVTWASDIAAMRHETLNSRLFQS